MDKKDLLDLYNYDAFIPEKIQPWMNFEDSPPVGIPAPDFPLWDHHQNRTSLREIWSQFTYTIVEFGSFT
jgi:hypothetical protein